MLVLHLKTQKTPFNHPLYETYMFRNIPKQKKGDFAGDFASFCGLNVQDTHIALKLYAFS
jgi:hypothetical protein